MGADKENTAAVRCFRNAYAKTMAVEGFYSNNPFDPGGETFLGISRHWHPSWNGWKMVDAYDVDEIPDFILNNLYSLAESFYRVQFWDRMQGDKLADLSPRIAEKVFDTAVNLSVTDSIRFLQDAMNLLNRNTELYPDIMVDGRIGKITVGTLERYLITRPGSPEENENRLLKVLGILQGYHYVEEMRKYPQKEIFRGWFDRATA